MRTEWETFEQTAENFGLPFEADEEAEKRIHRKKIGETSVVM